MCKHIHLGMLVASSRNIDLEKERICQANQIFACGQFFHDENNNELEVLSLYGLVSIVNLDSYKCSCFANSHGIICVCSLVAKKVVPLSNNHNDQDIINDDSIPPPEDTLERKIENKLQQITSFLHGEQLKSMTEKKKRSALQSLNQIYATCYTSNFSKKSNKRKQLPLFPNRNNKKTKTDHLYSTTRKKICKKSNTKINDDGSFKMSGRRMGTVRKPFQ